MEPKVMTWMHEVVSHMLAELQWSRRALVTWSC